MTRLETDILTTLRELDEAATRAFATNSKQRLLALFGQLDELTRQLPKNANPDLLHYLHRKSYEKARRLLESARQDKVTGRID